MSVRAVNLVEKAVICVSATSLLHLFLNANSPLYIVSLFPQLNVDLSFLALPLTVLFIFFFASNTSLVLVKQSRWKKATTEGLYGLTISIFILLLFERAPLPAFTKAILFPLELIVIVFTGSAITTDFLTHRKWCEPLLQALCTGGVAYAVYDIARVLSQVYEPIVYAALPFTVGLLTASVGELFRLLGDTDKSMVSKISKWISKGPIRNFALGFFLTLYINFVRPSVEGFPPTVIGEWIATAIVVAIILGAAKKSFRRLYTNPESPDWKKHTRQNQRQTGRDFAHLVSAQEKFVNRGIKEPLLVYLTLGLRDLGQTEERILITLAPLVQYRSKRPSFWSLPRKKRKLEKENRLARRKLLENLVQEIEKGG